MHTVEFEQIPSTDPRLGRNVEHDSRSRMFAYQADAASIVSAEHTSATPVLDQGNYGSCTGNASTKNLTYLDAPGDQDLPFWEAFLSAYPHVLSTTDAAANEKVAVSVYSDAEVIDGGKPFDPADPATDNGSTGLSVAKVLTSRGWIAGYQHSFSFDATLTALSRQAVIVGTNWYSGMMDPTSSGEILATGDVEGGHEYVLRSIDVEHKRIGMQNSWGEGWGIDGGQAWMSFNMLEQLLGEDGDCTIFVPLTSQPPEPKPPEPPTPPTPGDDPEATFVAQAEYWVGLRHSSKVNTDFEKQTQTYLDWLASRPS